MSDIIGTNVYISDLYYVVRQIIYFVLQPRNLNHIVSRQVPNDGAVIKCLFYVFWSNVVSI